MITKNKDDGVEKDALQYTHKLEEMFLLDMGDCGIWDKSVPATLERKRNLLFVIAKRQAKLKKQTEWLRERQEYYRQLREAQE